MSTKRPTLEEFSPEVRASNIQSQKLNEANRTAREDYRRKRSAPTDPVDHKDRIAKLAAGVAVAPVPDAATELRAAANLCHDLEEACTLHHKQAQPITYKALGGLGKTVLSEERSALKRIASGLVEAIAGATEYQELEDYLIGEGGCVGVCMSNHSKILGHPRDRAGVVATLLREFVALGVLDKMPASLR